MACKLNSMLTPHIHWIVQPKIILPMAQTPTPTMAYVAMINLRLDFHGWKFTSYHWLPIKR